MSLLKGLFRLIRPVNMVICALSVLCGSIIGGENPTACLNLLFNAFRYVQMTPYALKTCSAVISASFILAAGNVFNDVRDLSCDRINAPTRPIPSGIVTPGEATVFAVLLALIGIGFSFPLGVGGIAIAFCAVFLLLSYDVKLKRVPLLGNIVVSCLGGLAFIYGGIAGDSVSRSLIPAVFATLFHLGREIVKDAADADGDNLAGISTTATVFGIRTSVNLASFILITLSVLVAVPFIIGYFRIGYILIIALGVWPALFYTVDSLFRDAATDSLYRVSRVLKAAMPLGIFAVLVGFQGC